MTLGFPAFEFLPTHLHSAFFIVDFFLFDFDSFGVLNMIPLLMFDALISQYIISLSLTLYTVSLVEQKFSFFI